MAGETTLATPGQCTWWVAHLTKSWIDQYGNLGDAWSWAQNAHNAGASVYMGSPVVGSIAVWPQGYAGSDSLYGHVAVVTGVGADGSATVSEMNVKGSGVVDQRTLGPSVVRGLSFIYPPGNGAQQDTVGQIQRATPPVATLASAQTSSSGAGCHSVFHLPLGVELGPTNCDLWKIALSLAALGVIWLGFKAFQGQNPVKVVTGIPGAVGRGVARGARAFA